MKVFLISLAVSIVQTIIFWNFGVAAKIWPEHPMLLLFILAIVSGAIVQIVLPKIEAQQAAQKRARR